MKLERKIYETGAEKRRDFIIGSGVFFVTVDGRIIPFCTYNSASYREQVTKELIRAINECARP